jgi:hypothetical protein
MPVSITITADNPDELNAWLARLGGAGTDFRIAPPKTDTAIEAPKAANTSQASPTSSGAATNNEGEGGEDNAEDTRPMRGKNAQAAFERLLVAIEAAASGEALRKLLADEANVLSRLPQEKKQALNVAANSRLEKLKAGAPATEAKVEAKADTKPEGEKPVGFTIKDVEGMILGAPVDPGDAVVMLAEIADSQCPGGRGLNELMALNADTIKALPAANKKELKDVFDSLSIPAAEEAPAAQAEEGPDPSLDEIKTALENLVAKVNYQEAMGALKRAGASRVSELDTPAKRRAFLAECAKATAAAAA